METNQYAVQITESLGKGLSTHIEGPFNTYNAAWKCGMGWKHACVFQVYKLVRVRVHGDGKITNLDDAA